MFASSVCKELYCTCLDDVIPIQSALHQQCMYPYCEGGSIRDNIGYMDIGCASKTM